MQPGRTSYTCASRTARLGRALPWAAAERLRPTICNPTDPFLATAETNLVLQLTRPSIIQSLVFDRHDGPILTGVDGRPFVVNGYVFNLTSDDGNPETLANHTLRLLLRPEDSGAVVTPAPVVNTRGYFAFCVVAEWPPPMTQFSLELSLDSAPSLVFSSPFPIDAHQPQLTYTTAPVDALTPTSPRGTSETAPRGSPLNSCRVLGHPYW